MIHSNAPARYLQATAALIQQGQGGVQPQPQPQAQLLHLLAWMPAHRFAACQLSLAAFAWHWVCAESPALQVPSLYRRYCTVQYVFTAGWYGLCCSQLNCAVCLYNSRLVWLVLQLGLLCSMSLAGWYGFVLQCCAVLMAP